MARLRLVLAAAGAISICVVAVSVCAAERAPAQSGRGLATPTVTGTVAYRERIALPPNAVVEVTLEDVSRADAPAEAIGRARIPSPGQLPVGFVIPYQSADIVASHRYVVRGRITVDGKLLFTSDRVTPVLGPNPTSGVALVLVRVPPPPPPPPPAPPQAPTPPAMPPPHENRDWRAVRIGDRVLGPKDTLNPVTLMLDAATSRASGGSGCNRFTGPYQTRNNTLTFGALAGTRIACPSGMDVESAFLKALEGVRRWRIVEGHLELLTQTGTRLLVFEAAK